MSWITIAAMITIGLLLIMFEVFILPGITVAGVLGTIIVVVGVYKSYVELGMMEGHLTLLIAGVAMVAAFMASYKTAEHMALDYTLTSRVNEHTENQAVKVGDTGIAFGDIRPLGKATINGQVYEVRSTGDFIGDDSEIIVVKMDGNRILVKKTSLN